MKFFITIFKIFCIISFGYVPWKWTWSNSAGATQLYAGYSWIWNPPNPHIQLGIGWITHLDLERWIVQAVIIIVLLIVLGGFSKK